MPMPKPKPGEAEKDFVSRFMADQAMGVEYPDEAQRAAVAHSEWKRARKDADAENMSTVESIIESLSLRSLATRWGIGTALQYVKTINDVFAAGLTTPKLAFDLLPDVWAKELQSAARRLTYCDEAGCGEGGSDFMVKSIREGTDIARGAVLEYDCVLSTKRKDRDGDIVEPGGMGVDDRMPLLWQHVQSQPIGKHVKVLHQDEIQVRCRFAIADIPLGRDAATLVKFGALRKSHGFKPVPGEFEPLEIVRQADGKQVAKGWHIKKSSVMEGSLVSIPANADANVLAVYEKQFDGLCTAYSRNLLATNAVKQWAKALYDGRPVVVAVGGSMQTKSLPEVMESLEFPGSFEWIREQLQKQLTPPNSPSSSYRGIAATFADSAVFCTRSYYREQTEAKCFRQSWEMKDGTPTFTGEPKEIAVATAIVEKLFSELSVKGAGMSTQIVSDGKPDQTGKAGEKGDGQPLHDPQKKRCPKCERADLDSTNSCPSCGFVDHANTTKRDTPASGAGGTASENPGGAIMDVGKAAGDDLSTKCGSGGSGVAAGDANPAEGKQRKRGCKCGGAMGDDGKCAKCGGSEYAKAYDIENFSADDLARALAAKAVTGDPAARAAIAQVSALSAVVDAEVDPLAALFAE